MNKKMRSLIKMATALMLAAFMLTLLCSCYEEPRSVRNVRINDKGELIVIFTDGTESNVGAVKGDKGDAGEDGKDGLNGKDGENGTDGVDGEKGDKGATGTQGKNGRSVKKVEMTLDGNLRFFYDDGTHSDVKTRGELFLFGGSCGDSAEWGLYSGGVLVISGEGKTFDYEEGKTPWTPVASLVTAIYVDTSKGLVLGENIFYGMDGITKNEYESTTVYWVDMAVEAPIYSLPEDLKDVSATPVALLSLGEEIDVVSINEAEGYAKIVYDYEYAYIDMKYVRDNNGSVVYDDVDYLLTVINENGAKLRTFPDSYSNNASVTVPKDEKINCTGVSKNGNWYRVTYNGETLYVYKTVVELAE